MKCQGCGADFSLALGANGPKFCFRCFVVRQKEAAEWVERYKAQIFTRFEGRNASLAELETTNLQAFHDWSTEFRRRRAAGYPIYLVKDEPEQSETPEHAIDLEALGLKGSN